MRSIRKTITLSTLLWVGLLTAAGQMIIDRTVNHWLTSQFDNALEAKARALVTLTKNDGVEVELDFADEFMPEFESPTEPQYFELFLGDGSLLERSNSYDGYPESTFGDQPIEVRFSDLELPDGRDGRQIAIRFIPQIEDKALRLLIPEAERPRALLRVSRERESLDQVRTQFHLLIIGITLVILIAVALTVTRAINAGLRPLVEIRDAISRISPRAIDRRVASEGQPVELEPIAIQFNHVLEEIEKAFIREREFSADVAHELRTPVSEIRSLAEVGLRWPDEKDIRSYFGDIHESAKNLDRLIENLLFLCRSEEGSIELNIETLDLEQLLQNTARGLATELEENSVGIDLPPPPLPTVRLDAQWLEMILRNLLYNGIVHGMRDSKITVRCETSGKRCALEIENPMQEPLSKDDLEQIFNRFWRKDSARKTGRHAGIGLSLVKAYADLMQLEVTATITAQNNFRIRLVGIPLA